MYLKNGTGRLWKWTGIFFAAMIGFTLLSRALYQNSIAVVTATVPGNGTIAHRVQVSGKAVQNQELAVTTVAGLRIASVQVNEGQQVEQGDALFTLDMDYLEETITKQEQEMQKQKLSIQDAWSQSNASAQQRSNAQAQAEENYQSAVSQAQTVLDRAKRDLDRAQAALDAFYDGTSASQAEENALMESCQTAKTAYDAAVSALEQLKQEIEAEIQRAIAEAEQAQPAPEEEPKDPTLQQTDTTEAPEETQQAELPEVQTLDARTLTQAEKEAIAQSVRDGYAGQLAQAEQSVQQTQQALDDANEALETFRQEQADSPKLSEQDLLDNLEKAQENYEDAQAALEQAKTVYGRAVESAGLPDATNSSAQIGQITYDQMALALDKLNALREAEGKVLAPVDGIVTASYLKTGDKTTDTTAVLLADLSQGCKFSGMVAEEQVPYIGVGDRVLIQAESNGKVYEDLPVTTLSGTEEEGGYRITVQLPAGTLSLGAAAQLQFTRKSQPYACCVPVSALHLDGQNQPYLLAIREVNTVLGPQLQAQKVSVTVLDRNETMAALEEGTVSPQEKIIVSSDRTIEPGSRVRVE